MMKSFKLSKMYKRLLFISLLFSALGLASCSEQAKSDSVKQTSGSNFDKTKWQVKEGEDYPFRAEMVNDILYNDTIRTFNQAQVLELLGALRLRTEFYI